MTTKTKPPKKKSHVLLRDGFIYEGDCDVGDEVGLKELNQKAEYNRRRYQGRWAVVEMSERELARLLGLPLEPIEKQAARRALNQHTRTGGRFEW